MRPAWEDIDLVKGEIHVSRSLTNKRVFVPPKTDAGIRTITLPGPALDALKEQCKITGTNPKQEIRFHHREIGKTEQQSLRYFTDSIFVQERQLLLQELDCLWPERNPSFIASQMGHEDARMVYEVYSKWIGDMNPDQVNMLNNQMPTALPPGRPHGRGSMKKVI